ncbi:MAG: AMMECR1 domain-containing protein [Gammaproteobacteria bacterium]|nr:MAG: AMMECR1 domain-containing protein [Gammaproteobacteria bacterium]
MRFIEPQQAAKDYLLAIAKQAIEYRLMDKAQSLNLPEQFSSLEKQAATFVTLKDRFNSLRGCIGTLQAHEPLYLSVAHNAVSAAFNDPRFAPMTADEWPDIKLSISILSEPSPLLVASEQDLKQQLNANVDGLILREGARSATFLPSVWEDLPDKEQFLSHLKQKAGFAADYWSDTLRFSRYQSYSFKS